MLHLFTNAGMNQFKDIFTGKQTVDYKRATTAQKCLRASGKHNDFDKVGFTARHHTFFEMLGNFSFGDYFKEEAIVYAWEWITKELKLPKDKLWASVYETDDDAFALWEKIAPELRNGRILRFGKKDNFWSLGDVGPCGPCSEIHVDRGEKYASGKDDRVNGEGDRFIEIWNLVFMQYDQTNDGQMAPLPKPSVDTGAGLERIASILQGTDTNYGIDLFQNIIEAISETTKSRYEDNKSSHHVIADHLRALTFSLADGAGISNEGRGHVLRKILRRAARHGQLLGAHEPFIYKLVPTLVKEMGSAYPEIREKESHVMNVLKAEEESFGRMLETGLELFENVAEKLRATIRSVVPGKDIFRLYDTHGFPYDVTEMIASVQGLTLDRIGFELAMEEQQERSRAGSKFESHGWGILSAYRKGNVQLESTIFVRESLATASVIQLRDSDVSSETGETHFHLVLNQTPFYVESGGQVSDTGVISVSYAQIRVLNVYKYQDAILHEGIILKGKPEDFSADTLVTAQVDIERRWDIMRNHTATHLLQAAMRKVLGEHVKQSGSYVGPDRLRFDFSHHQPVTRDEMAQIEQIVNEQIISNLPVHTDPEVPVAEAKKSGAMALFGEKYGDTVRVVSVGSFSKELCGGTHVENVGQIGPLMIVVETGIASGVRRIEAITGRAAIETMLKNKQSVRQIAALVNRTDTEVIPAIEQLQQTVSDLQKEVKKVKAAMFTGGTKSVGQEIAIGPSLLVTHDFGETDKDTIAAWVDSYKSRADAVIVAAVGKVDGKSTFMSAATGLATQKLKLDIGSLSKELLPQFGGRGGGKPSFAQGGVADNTNPTELFERLALMIKDKLEEANA